jgi:hypothetical protein
MESGRAWALVVAALLLPMLARTGGPEGHSIIAEPVP